jgi:hypothetical protein
MCMQSRRSLMSMDLFETSLKDDLFETSLKDRCFLTVN